MGSGIVTSLARPGGNLTGTSNLGYELAAKEYETLVEVAPKVRRIAYLSFDRDNVSERTLAAVQAAARSRHGPEAVGVVVASNATSRRYWWLSLCGAATAGATMDAQGKLLGDIIQTPFFFQEDGRNPSIQNWNCLQLFPRDGWGFALPPTNTRPESDLRVMVNLPNKGARDSVVNVSPPATRTGRGCAALSVVPMPSSPTRFDHQQ